MTRETSDALGALGIDVNNFDWYQLSVCAKLGEAATPLFYEQYESSDRTAKLVDDMCLSCPVRTACLVEGIENKEWGCWGAVFLENGKISESKNEHKTEDIWEQIRGGQS